MISRQAEGADFDQRRLEDDAVGVGVRGHSPAMLAPSAMPGQTRGRNWTGSPNGHNIMAMAKKRPGPKSRVGAAEFKARCLELIDQVRESRTQYVVTRHGEPVAQLVPVDAPAPVSPLGVMRGTLLKYDGPFDPIPAAWSLEQPDSDEV